jgi:hypothetical protein
MAVFIGFINVVVPVSVLNEKYPGGLEGYIRDHGGGTFCCDGHLTRVGFMVPPLVGDFIEELERKGLQPLEGENWKDLAVVDSIFKRATAPCDWVYVGTAQDGRVFACLKEQQHEPGEICGPRQWHCKNTIN